MCSGGARKFCLTVSGDHVCWANVHVHAFCIQHAVQRHPGWWRRQVHSRLDFLGDRLSARIKRRTRAAAFLAQSSSALCGCHPCAWARLPSVSFHFVRVVGRDLAALWVAALGAPTPWPIMFVVRVCVSAAVGPRSAMVGTSGFRSGTSSPGVSRCSGNRIGGLHTANSRRSCARKLEKRNPATSSGLVGGWRAGGGVGCPRQLQVAQRLQVRRGGHVDGPELCPTGCQSRHALHERAGEMHRRGVARHGRYQSDMFCLGLKS